jgi:hypothetical protein
MCTVSVFKLSDGHSSPGPSSAGSVRSDRPGPTLRIVFNRDEEHDRPPATTVDRREHSGVTMLMPIDPTSGGSWIGINSAGLIACLLNRREQGGPGPAAGSPSRGSIVPRLLAELTLDAALAEVAVVLAEPFPPFRVLLVQGENMTLVEGGVSATRGTPRRDLEILPLAQPLMLTSSGLGDGLVERARRPVFERLLATDGATAEVQDRFHAQRDPRESHLAVMMSREDARTVSRTTLTIGPTEAELRYESFGMNLEPLAPTISMRLAVAADGARR